MKEVVYTPESPVRAPRDFIAAMYRDVQDCRELAWRLFVRDTSARYRQSVLGYVWAFMPALAVTGTFVFLNRANIINIESTTVPYPVFTLVGSLLWQAFLDALNSPLNSLRAARPMLTKINFPREALLLAGMYQVLFNVSIRLVLLVPAFWMYKLSLGWSALLFPVGLLALLVLGAGIGLCLTPIGTLYTDIGSGIGMVAGFMMLLTPVVYPPPSSGIGAILAKWNPISPLLQAARNWLTGQPVDQLAVFLLVSALGVVMLVIGWVLFRITMPMLVERMGG